jgi:hypothetical protein
MNYQKDNRLDMPMIGWTPTSMRISMFLLELMNDYILFRYHHQIDILRSVKCSYLRGMMMLRTTSLVVLLYSPHNFIRRAIKAVRKEIFYYCSYCFCWFINFELLRSVYPGPYFVPLPANLFQDPLKLIVLSSDVSRLKGKN